MDEITQDAVLNALRTVKDLSLRDDLVSLGFIKDLKIAGGDVSFMVELPPPSQNRQAEIARQCETALRQIPGIGKIQAQTRVTGVVAPGSQKRGLPGIASVIGVASGKGGVGKSTVAVNLACSLARSGARVGLLDADIYGPSIPMMMNAFDQLEGDSETQKIRPLERYGVKLMSIGFMNPKGDPIIWRGPIVSRTIQQLLSDVGWGELDFLLVDLPPGTGDAPLTLAQAVPLSGVVIVLTPQDVALNIASKSLAMFQRPPFEVPILGIVENMSTFVCPHCHTETHIFGPERGVGVARDFGVPFLGSIPLNTAIAESGDAGKPIVVSAPDSPQSQAFGKVAAEMRSRLEALQESTVKKPGGFIGLERLFGPRKPKAE